MTEEMKKTIYSVLNLLDFLETVNFLTVDFDKVNQLRQVLFDSINESTDQSEAIKLQENSKYKLISFLPDFFGNKKIFKNKEDVINFALQKMGIVPAAKWENKTLDDITGNIIIEIIKAEDELYQKSISAIHQYMIENPDTTKSKTSNFMNMWFDYFESNRKGRLK